MGDQLDMKVSPVCEKNGKKFAYVSFSDGNRVAEGLIPDCTIISNEGFTQAEQAQLELYMKQELAKLKRMAAGVNALDAFLGRPK